MCMHIVTVGVLLAVSLAPGMGFTPSLMHRAPACARAGQRSSACILRGGARASKSVPMMMSPEQILNAYTNLLLTDPWPTKYV